MIELYLADQANLPTQQKQAACANASREIRPVLALQTKEKHKHSLWCAPIWQPQAVAVALHRIVDCGHLVHLIRGLGAYPQAEKGFLGWITLTLYRQSR